MGRSEEHVAGREGGLEPAPAPARGTRAGFPDGLWLALALALALAVRLLPFAAATEGRLRLLSPDCYGHLRRATAVARSFPHVPVFDPYLNHPDGGIWIWPPVFDLVVGGAARAVFGAGATQEEVAWVAALVPPLLGALQLLPLAALARRVLSRRRARLAVAVMALLPAAVLWGCFGHADHHVAEVLALLLVLAAAARTADPGLAPGRRTAWAATTGALLALAVLTWQGAVFVAALLLPWAALALPGVAVVTGVVATGLVWLATVATLGGVAVPFTYVSFGMFQPAFLAALTVAVAAWAAFRARRRAARLAWAGVAVALLLVLAPLLPQLAAATLRGAGYVAGRSGSVATARLVHGGYLAYPESFLAVVAEVRPLLRGPWLATGWSALTSFSPGLLALPLALLWWLARARPRMGAWTVSTRAWQHLLLAGFGVAVLAMGLMQQRMGYYLAPFAALGLAEAWGRVRWAPLRRRPWLEVAAVLLLVGGLGWGRLASVAAYSSAPGEDFLGLLAELRAADPPPADPAALPPPAPGAVPGVFGPWAAGHFITAMTWRPAAADPFAYGWLRQCLLFTATDDAEVEAILRQARCRYLLTADLRPVLPAYARAAGRGDVPVEAMLAARVHESVDPRPLPFLDLVLQSRRSHPLPDGRLVPDFRVWRVRPASGAGAASP